MAINPNADFNELKIWLEENLTDKKSIKACCQEVNIVPETKGIYFWFMKIEGYDALKIQPTNPLYQRTFNSEMYDLVYLGTAGVRNNSSGINKGHLRERIKWHLCDNKNVSALCTGKNPTMSTLRSTIGGLIGDDLIGNNTQDKVDELLCKYFVTYYIEYPGAFLDVKDEVNGDEDILINVIRPIFNLKKNPNAQNPNHLTYKIQEKKQQIINSSRNKWCNINYPIRKSNSKVNIPYQSKNRGSELISEKDCIEFTVKKTKNIAIETALIANIPVGPCTIELFYENRADVRLYINGKKRKIRVLNRTVRKYFEEPDTANGNILKWEIVHNEMNNPNNIIEEITVRVCPIKK
jgi:hypothetical protein